MSRKHRIGWMGAVAISAAGALIAPLCASAPRPFFHDPRTTAKKLSQALEIEGAGKLTFDFKALHYNDEMFKRAKTNDKFLGFLNQQIWGRMGSAKLEFEIVSEELKLGPGTYDFGINMTKDDQFSIVFWKGEEKLAIPLSVEHGAKEVKYLSVTMLATEDVDTFTIEARCGPFTGCADVKIPYLDPDHEEKHEDGSQLPSKAGK